MPADYTKDNESAMIIAEALIESARIYAETMNEATEQIVKLFKDVKDKHSVLVREMAELQKKIKEETSSPPATAVTGKYSLLVKDITALSEEQRQAKKERNLKKYKGKRKYPTEREAQIAVARNSQKLRAMWAASASIRGISFNTIEQNVRNKNPHPVYEILEDINNCKEKYGYSPIKAPAGVIVKNDKPPKKETVAEEKKSENVTYGIRVQGNVQKLSLTKFLKETMNIGLKEAKEMADKTPDIIPCGMTKKEAEDLAAALIKNGYESSVIVANA